MIFYYLFRNQHSTCDMDILITAELFLTLLQLSSVVEDHFCTRKRQILTWTLYNWGGFRVQLVSRNIYFVEFSSDTDW